jgi:hypothetical protein
MAGKLLKKLAMENFLENLRQGFLLAHVGTEDDYVCKSAVGKICASKSAGNYRIWWK